MSKSISICNLEAEIQELKRQLSDKETQLRKLKLHEENNPYCLDLTSHEVCRYSRQMIIPEIDVKGQVALKNSKVLVVGAGGLGCPALIYLAAAGVGNLGIVDCDNVELSNLHRQILHSEQSLGVPKSISAMESVKRLNGDVNVTPLQIHLNRSNVLDVIKDYDVVLDGTDNVATRYLLNDACVLKNKPLVSGSALQYEGQLTVYHFRGGPCYRCLFPRPPPAETVTSCSDGGVIGAVPGCIGVLQAIETIKIILNMPDVLAGRLVLYDASTSTFRNVWLRKRDPYCQVCGNKPTINAPIDYEQFCNTRAHDKGEMINILPLEERISPDEYKILEKNNDHILIDVRSAPEFKMCKLPNSINIPFNDIQKVLYDKKSEFVEKWTENNINSVYVVCRRGNDSQRAVQIFKNEFTNTSFQFKDIMGGLHAYSALIDSRFPVY